MGIIAEDSPLRRIPMVIEPRQASCFEGIRLTAEMIDSAYQRLVTNLIRFSFNPCAQELASIGTATLFLDAWSVVDCLNRLRTILAKTPKFKKTLPPLQIYERATKSVVGIRNIVQHLGEEIDRTSTVWPMWGILSWVAIIDPKAGLCRSCSVIGGRIVSGEHQLVNPLEKGFAGIVDHVHLAVKTESIELSSAVRSVGPVVNLIERNLYKQLPDSTSTGSDAFVFVDCVTEIASRIL